MGQTILKQPIVNTMTSTGLQQEMAFNPEGVDFLKFV